MSLGFHVTAPAGSAVLPAATVRRRPRSGPDARAPERAVEWAQCAGCGHASVTGVRRACGSGAHPRHWGLCVVFGSVGSGLSALSWAAYGWCPAGGGGGVAPGGGSRGDGEFPVVGSAGQKVADQGRGWSGRWGRGRPRGGCGGRCSGARVRCEPGHAAGPVAYSEGGVGLRWRSVARTPTASGCQWMGSVGIPTMRDFANAKRRGGVHVGARPASSTASAPRARCSAGRGQGRAATLRLPEGRSISQRDFGQGVGGALLAVR